MTFIKSELTFPFKNPVSRDGAAVLSRDLVTRAASQSDRTVSHIGRFRMDGRLFSPIFVLFLLPFSSCHTYYLSDKAGLGRVFEGIGGLSGGGVSPAQTSVLELQKG